MVLTGILYIQTFDMWDTGLLNTMIFMLIFCNLFLVEIFTYAIECFIVWSYCMLMIF